jgi:hypothetical protein
MKKRMSALLAKAVSFRVVNFATCVASLDFGNWSCPTRTSSYGYTVLM